MDNHEIADATLIIAAIVLGAELPAGLFLLLVGVSMVVVVALGMESHVPTREDLIQMGFLDEEE